MLPPAVLYLIKVFGKNLFQLVLGLVLSDACISYPNGKKPNYSPRLELSQGLGCRRAYGLMSRVLAALFPFLAPSFRANGIWSLK